MTADTHPAQAEPGADQAPDEAPAPCRMCEIVPGILGLLAAGVIVFVSLDLLKGGALTVAALRMIGRGAPPDEHTAESAD